MSIYVRIVVLAVDCATDVSQKLSIFLFTHTHKRTHKNIPLMNQESRKQKNITPPVTTAPTTKKKKEKKMKEKKKKQYEENDDFRLVWGILNACNS